MKNKKAHTIWRRNVKKISENRLKEMRQDMGIPEMGFTTDTEKESWDKMERKYLKSLDIKSEEDLASKEITKSGLYKKYKYINEISKDIPELVGGFDGAIEELILFNDVLDSTLERCNATGCKFVVTSKHKIVNDDGVYIRVGPDTTPSDIKDFVSKKTNTLYLRHWQETVYGRKPKRIKLEKFDQQDLCIFLNGLSLERLKLIYKERYKEDPDEIGVIRRKDIMAVRILKKERKAVSLSNYRQIISRTRRRKSV